MNAPNWLSTLLSIAMIAVACYALARMLIAQGWRRGVDYETDALLLLAGLATAGLISNWARTLPRPGWTVVFVAGGVYLAVRAARVWTDTRARRPLLGGLGCCAVLVYAFTADVAPSAIHGSTAGAYTMAGMPGMIVDQTERFPALGLALVVALAFASVVAVNRAGSMPQIEQGPAIGGPRDGAPVPLSPRSVLLCHVALLLVLAFAILGKIV
ncbi:hypothetical protein KDL01_14455 [Actinospica durhamensis]|uniref:DUF5134 domain-containing protein n=1 Tax=Actinospica durhamensis TaxID=1508375 RepID=A0A941EP10_9ACTN|nr:hypothetical protein [Actinospica durhamensis]MBR7834473.1 hypothetical protein [Actinospica durhamensis]